MLHRAARGLLPRALPLTLAVAGLFLAGGASAGGDADYASELVEAARAGRLAADPEWLKLGHYRPRLLGGHESDADGLEFFLAPSGKDDPAAELEATLKGFFDPAPADEKKQHPQCQFPARLAWLTERLRIDPARLPAQTCTRLQEFWERVAARSVTLVFSAYYLNNPASAFGHTFLRLNKADAAREGRRFELLDYGVGYSATVDTQNPVLYLVKGLGGQFRGRWDHYPYFYKVREYADFESRDLWEYDLDLTPQETARLVAHLWELGSTWFDYFYLTENCSYGVLAALEAAAPRLSLLDHVRRVVLPADTLKALLANPGLVRAVQFRPSIRTQFRARLDALTPDEVDAVGELVASAAAPARLPPASEARALDAALDYVDLTYARDLLFNAVTPGADLKQRLMERRSALGVQSEEFAVAMPTHEQPHLGHGSMRVAAGGGAYTRKGPLAVLDLRLALHDLADPLAGYPSLAQIEFFPVRLRYEPRSNALGVEHVLAMGVTSLTDMARFDHHLSWRFRVGATTVRDAGCADCLAGVGSIGGGAAKVLARDRVTVFATADVDFAGAPSLSGLGGSPVRFGLGPSGGVRLAIADRLSILGEGGWRWLPDATPASAFDLKLTARVHLGRWSVWAEGAHWPIGSQALLGASLFL